MCRYNFRASINEKAKKPAYVLKIDFEKVGIKLLLHKLRVTIKQMN